MKNYLLLLSMLISFSIFSQYTKNERTIVSLQPQRVVTLNSAVRAATLEGTTRVVIPIDLPKNTIEWFYSFTTNDGVSGMKNLNLALQLSSFVIDYTGTSASLLSKIQVPAGSLGIDSYLLLENSRIPFLEKWDQNGGTFNYTIQGSTENTKQAIVRINSIKSGRCYIGLRNPSSLDAVVVTIEVSAIVENKIFVDEWIDESKNKIKQTCLNSFNTDGFGKNTVCDCVTENICSKQLPSYWNSQNKENQNLTIESEKNNCFINTNNMVLKNEEDKFLELKKKEQEELNKLFEVAQQIYRSAQAASQIADYSDAFNKYKELVQFIEQNLQLKKNIEQTKIASYYNSIVWFSILSRNQTETSEFIKKGFSYDPNNMYLRINLAWLQLIQGKTAEGKNTLVYYKKREKLPNGYRWIQAIEEDLNLLESLNIKEIDYQEIREYLEIK